MRDINDNGRTILKQTERAGNVLVIKNLGSQSLSAVFSRTTLASINFATRLVFLALLPGIRVRMTRGAGGGGGGGGGPAMPMISVSLPLEAMILGGGGGGGSEYPVSH